MKNNINKKNGGTFTDFVTNKDFKRLKEKSEDLIKDIEELNIPTSEEFEELPRSKQQMVIAEMETIRDKYDQLDSFFEMEFTEFFQASETYVNIEEIEDNYTALVKLFGNKSYTNLTIAEKVIYTSFSKNIEENIKKNNELLLLPTEQKNYLKYMKADKPSKSDRSNIWKFLRNTVIPILKEVKERIGTLKIFYEAETIYYDYILGSFKEFNVKPSVKKEDKTGDKTKEDKTGDKTKETPMKVKIPERLNKQEAIDKLIALRWKQVMK